MPDAFAIRAQATKIDAAAAELRDALAGRPRLLTHVTMLAAAAKAGLGPGAVPDTVPARRAFPAPGANAGAAPPPEPAPAAAPAAVDEAFFVQAE